MDLSWDKISNTITKDVAYEIFDMFEFYGLYSMSDMLTNFIQAIDAEKSFSIIKYDRIENKSKAKSMNLCNIAKTCGGIKKMFISDYNSKNNSYHQKYINILEELNRLGYLKEDEK